MGAAVNAKASTVYRLNLNCNTRPDELTDVASRMTGVFGIVSVVYAHMSIIWAIVTALLAGAGAMTGQIFGPIVTARRQQRQWLRDERASAAQSLSIALEAADRVLDDMEWDRSGHIQPETSQYAERASEVDVQIRSAISKMRVFATPSVLNSARTVANAFLEMHNAYGRPEDQPFRLEDGTGVVLDWRECVVAYRTTSLAAINAIRADLDVPSLPSSSGDVRHAQ